MSFSSLAFFTLTAICFLALAFSAASSQLYLTTLIEEKSNGGLIEQTFLALGFGFTATAAATGFLTIAGLGVNFTAGFLGSTFFVALAPTLLIFAYTLDISDTSNVTTTALRYGFIIKVKSCVLFRRSYVARLSFIKNIPSCPLL